MSHISGVVMLSAVAPLIFVSKPGSLFDQVNHAFPGSAKANGREPKSCLGRVFNFKLGHFVFYAIAWHIKKHALA